MAFLVSRSAAIASGILLPFTGRVAPGAHQNWPVTRMTAKRRRSVLIKDTYTGSFFAEHLLSVQFEGSCVPTQHVSLCENPDHLSMYERVDYCESFGFGPIKA